MLKANVPTCPDPRRIKHSKKNDNSNKESTTESEVKETNDKKPLTTEPKKPNLRQEIRSELKKIKRDRRLNRQRRRLSRLQRKDRRIQNREFDDDYDMLTGLRKGKAHTRALEEIEEIEEEDDDLLIDRPNLADRSLDFVKDLRPEKQHSFKKRYSHKPNAYNLEICEQNFNKYESNRGRRRRTLRN